MAATSEPLASYGEYVGGRAQAEFVEVTYSDGMSTKRKFAIAIVASLLLLATLVAVLWVTLRDDHTGNLANTPADSSVEFTAQKMVGYLNSGGADMDFTIDPDGATYTESRRAFEQASPEDGCEYEYSSSSFDRVIGADEGGDRLGGTEGSSGIAIQHVMVDKICNGQHDGRLNIEFGVIPDMGSWSRILRIYSTRIELS